jgi:hypothetical protein
MTGATYHKNNRSWQAKITYQGKQYHIGTYFTQAKAHEAYKKKKRELISGKEATMK